MADDTRVAHPAEDDAPWLLGDKSRVPVLAALFVGWHGLLSIVCFWYLARKWLLERRRRPLVIGAAAVGLYWGVWSIVYRLPEATEDFDQTFAVMKPGDFTIHALSSGRSSLLPIGSLALFGRSNSSPVGGDAGA